MLLAWAMHNIVLDCLVRTMRVVVLARAMAHDAGCWWACHAGAS